MNEGFSLEDLQKWMLGTITRPRAADVDRVEERMLPNQRLSASGRLAIYQNAYILRLTACMRDQFPALCHALGTELFNDFVRDYLNDHPPESYTLHDLGRRFPMYLEQTRPDASDAPEDWVDFVIDLARFERQVFVTFDGPASDDDALATADIPDCQLAGQVSLSLLDCGAAVGSYYHAMRRGDDPDIPPKAPCSYAIFRARDITHTVPLGQMGRIIVAHVLNGGTPDSVADDRARAAWCAPDSLRREWIELGMFAFKHPVI